jgi:hypothetical protein
VISKLCRPLGPAFPKPGFIIYSHFSGSPAYLPVFSCRPLTTALKGGDYYPFPVFLSIQRPVLPPFLLTTNH